MFLLIVAQVGLVRGPELLQGLLVALTLLLLLLQEKHAPAGGGGGGGLLFYERKTVVVIDGIVSHNRPSLTLSGILHTVTSTICCYILHCTFNISASVYLSYSFQFEVS